MQTKRLLFTIFGCVQGVGFRPFVYRLAREHQLIGHIKNTSRGVEIDAQGSLDALANFKKDLITAKPQRATISEIKTVEASLSNGRSFEIEMSDKTAETTLALLPDSGMCSECLNELSDPMNRRYQYPFLHCMTCGPRFSLFYQMPFDRQNTTMADFSMCDLCQREYTTPSDRRFYSQTNCCPECGPELKLLENTQTFLASKQEAIDAAAQYLAQGKIVAIKNTGGFLLLVDGTNEQAVNRLRLRRRRAKKPFALLMPNLLFAKQAAHIDQTAEKVLTSPAAPIVLLKKRLSNQNIAPSVICESPYYGIMLPHNPLQHLLLSALKRPLVATSGNMSGKPICIEEETAFAELSTVADAFLVHNRSIIHRLDDSIVQIIADRPMIIRRARGYIPCAIDLPATTSMLGVGGHLKNSFAIAKGRQIYLSQYMGNLDCIEACKVYDKEIKSVASLLNTSPSFAVGDKHPDYYTSHYLQKWTTSAEFIQHHKAHVYSGMLDNQLAPPLLGFSWDGTGLGDDNTIWGGEAFIVTQDGIERFASLLPFRLPGSEKAVKEPRRSALGLLHVLFGQDIPPIYQKWAESAFTEEELRILSKGINAPVCSSMGRLFDAVSALLNICLVSDFEGQAALSLEALANQAKNKVPRYTLSLLKEKNIWLIDWRDMIQKIVQDKKDGAALGFHLALAQVIVAIAKKAGLENVLLTGGVMQNKLLAELAIDQLKEAGFKPFWHHQIPPNDSGLAPGQILGAIKNNVFSSAR